MVKFIKFVFCILSFTLLYGCQKQELYKDNRVMMGTVIEVSSSDKRAAGIVFKEVERIENLLSKYKEDSDVSRLNKSGREIVSPEAMYVIKKAKEFWSLSDGAFDITMAPLVELWGFKDKKYVLPEQGKIDAALQLIGTDKIVFDDSNNMIEFIVPGMQIDLGAIAKGYAVDSAVEKLKEHGINNCLVNAGRQVYCLGDKFGSPWNVAIKDPRREGFFGLLKLKDRAVATSGDYEQYFIKDGRRYAHIFNPKTGYPAESGIVSVTVITNDSLTADALSTAIFVLGREKGEGLLKKFPNVKVEIIEEKDIKI
ncbi:MAG: FAD:protein FMN transferase [Candidatus Omnitrophica bacterium]|nr:FAD:protein FMN transferase [Candidatus Omnitrophota bacterium]